MNKKFKSLKTVILPVCFIACMLLFNACNSSRHSRSIIKIKKWLNWEITFKKNTSEEEKAKSLAAIDKYIIDYLSKQNFFISRIQISHINFTDHSIPNVPGVIVQVNLEGTTSSGAVATIRPRGPGPRYELLNISSDILDIKIVGIDPTGSPDRK